MNDVEKMSHIEQAVLVNTVRPTDGDMKKIKIKKRILTSPSVEGDTKLGMALCVGFADSLKVDEEEIMSYLRIETAAEFKSRLGDFQKQDNDKMNIKKQLVRKYLELKNVI
jgi:hypothetical protein